MAQVGDKPGHPFRGNQYQQSGGGGGGATPGDVAERRQRLAAHYEKEGGATKEAIENLKAGKNIYGQNEGRGDTSVPDFNHLAKENSLPAKVSDVPSGGKGAYGEAPPRSGTSWLSLSPEEKRQTLIRESDAKRQAAIDKRAATMAEKKAAGWKPAPRTPSDKKPSKPSNWTKPVLMANGKYVSRNKKTGARRETLPKGVGKVDRNGRTERLVVDNSGMIIRYKD
jgi:hypothetical protein